MKPVAFFVALLLSASIARAADTPATRPWQSLSNPTVAEVAAHFDKPPAQNAFAMTWGWAGNVTPAVITADLDSAHARGINTVTIEAGKITNAAYLTPEYFDLVKTAVAEAKKRDMHIWFINESKYPSGFAGGKFSAEKPELRMQLLTIGERITLGPGGSIDRKAPDGFICAVATSGDGTPVVIAPVDGQIKWTPPAGPGGNWQITFINHIFDTAPTRSSTSPNGAKDKHDSLMDYLNPAATKQFLDWTEEQYKKAVGDEFGKTLLGFRGDEPEFPEGAPQPYTPAILDEFLKKKGYDPRPYLPLILAPAGAGGDTTALQRRVHADYVDVWSDLYRDNYFGQEAGWCAANNLEFQVHIDHEERQMNLVRSDGDFFKCMRYLQVPGIDTIQNQISPTGPIADFPKFASSCAHLFGHPTAWCEAFAAYQNMDLPTCQWVVNHLLVRGINRFEFMFNSSGFGARGPRGYMGDPKFPDQAAFTNRACYLLAQGTPAAKIGLYCPTSSFWLGDNAAYQNFLAAAQALLEHQRDCDFVDEQALSDVLKPGKSPAGVATLVNLSGQGYEAIIVPQCSVLSKAALDHLQAFAAAGGKVIVLGHDPSLIADKNFLTAKPPAAFTWATHEPAAKVTDAVLAALPATDITLDKPSPAIKAIHRRLADADVFLFFNESDQPADRTASMVAQGQLLQEWNPATGKITPIPFDSNEAGIVVTPLHLGGGQARFYVVSTKH